LNLLVPRAIPETCNGTRANFFCALQRLFRFTKNHHRRAAFAGGDAKACRKSNNLIRSVERFGKDVHAQALGQHPGIGCAAAGQYHQEFVVADAA
jgi:hypothetical protein